MLRSLIVLLSLLLSSLIACSKDQPKPMDPAGKISSAQSDLPKPQNLRVSSITDTSALIAWDAVEGADDYDINYKYLPDGKWTVWPHRGQVTHTAITGLSPKIEYRWGVKADRGNIKSRWALGPNFTTLPTPIDTPQITQDNPIDTIQPSGLFNIELLYDGSWPSHTIEAIEESARQWERVIVQDIQDGKLSDVWHVNAGGDDRGIYPDGIEYNMEVDDIIVVVRPTPDPNCCYGYADYGTIRQGAQYGDHEGIPFYGIIYMPDIYKNYRDPKWGEPNVEWEYNLVRWVSLHELGHILGLVPFDREGRWDKYTSEATTEVFNAAIPEKFIRFARSYTPVAGHHWGNYKDDYEDYYVLTNSTMSQSVIDPWRGIIDQTKRKNHMDHLSTITTLDAAALSDLGYSVDVNEVEPLVIQFSKSIFGDPQPAGKPTTTKLCGGIGDFKSSNRHYETRRPLH